MGTNNGEGQLSTIKRILSEGFRIFFLSAGLYGVFIGLTWATWLGTQSSFSPSVLNLSEPQLWHAHEMTFGYAGAAIGGFFLTAVPNWTNTPAARIPFLSIAFSLWLAGRLAIWFSGAMPPELVAIIDLAFIPFLALKIASQLIKRPKPQNMMFLLILSLLWVGNLFVHLEWIGWTNDTAHNGLRGGLFALCAMIVVLGGRVTPAFTRNAMKREGTAEADWPRSCKVSDRASLILGLILPLTVFLHLPLLLSGLIACLLGAIQIIRLTRWRARWAWHHPLLFSLHLGLSMLGLGLLLWGASIFGFGDEIAALHVIGIGGIGGMTLAVMSRASLGHSGQPLIAPRPIVIAYGLLASTAIARWVIVWLNPTVYFPLMAAISMLWALVFILFIISLWPALTQPRKTT